MYYNNLIYFISPSPACYLLPPLVKKLLIDCCLR